MESVSMISAVGMGVIVALAAPVLVWTLVMVELRQVVEKTAGSEWQRDMQPGEVDV